MRSDGPLARLDDQAAEDRAPGAAIAGMIPLCVPEVRGSEWAYVKECIDTGWVSSVGGFVNRFEHALAETVGTTRAVAVTSGTAAIHIALLLAGVEADDEVVTSTLTFIAPANAVRYIGAWPVFIDAEAEYWQMDPQKLIEFLSRDCQRAGGTLTNKKTGRRVRAILPVHILGHPVDMDPILEIAGRYGLRVIEDATESLGAAYKGRPVGSLGHAGCFSFNGNKIITTGGGGMIVTSNDQWSARARYLTTQAKDNAIEYIHNEVGYNYRLTNVLAAIGCAQLEQLAEYIAAKRRIAARYNDAFQNTPGITPMRQAPWASSIWWMYTVLLDPLRFGVDRRSLLVKLEAAGIQARPLWQPLHRSPAHSAAYASNCEVAEEIHRCALSLPCSVGLAPDDQTRVIDAIQAIGSAAA